MPSSGRARRQATTRPDPLPHHGEGRSPPEDPARADAPLPEPQGAPGTLPADATSAHVSRRQKLSHPDPPPHPGGGRGRANAPHEAESPPPPRASCTHVTSANAEEAAPGPRTPPPAGNTAQGAQGHNLTRPDPLPHHGGGKGSPEDPTKADALLPEPRRPTGTPPSDETSAHVPRRQKLNHPDPLPHPGGGRGRANPPQESPLPPRASGTPVTPVNAEAATPRLQAPLPPGNTAQGAQGQNLIRPDPLPNQGGGKGPSDESKANAPSPEPHEAWGTTPPSKAAAHEHTPTRPDPLPHQGGGWGRAGSHNGLSPWPPEARGTPTCILVSKDANQSDPHCRNPANPHTPHAVAPAAETTPLPAGNGARTNITATTQPTVAQMPTRTTNIPPTKARLHAEAPTMNCEEAPPTATYLTIPYAFGQPLPGHAPRGTRLGPIQGHIIATPPPTRNASDEWGLISPTTAIEFEAPGDKPRHSCRPTCAIISYQGHTYIECMTPLRNAQEITCDWTVGNLYPYAHPITKCDDACACEGRPPLPKRLPPPAPPPPMYAQWHKGKDGETAKRRTNTRPHQMKPRHLESKDTPSLLTRHLANKHDAQDPCATPEDLEIHVDQELINARALSCLKQPTGRQDSEACITETVVAAWLELWGKATGAGYHNTLPAPNNNTWIADSILVQQITKDGYSAWTPHTAHRRGLKLPAVGADGKLIITRIIVPIHIPGGTGHWITGVIDLSKKTIEMADPCAGARHDRLGATIGRWWDDTSRLYNGLSWGAQNWKVTNTRPSEQNNGHDCGIHMLAYISALTGGTRPNPGTLDKAALGSLRNIITGDLLNAGITLRPPNAPEAMNPRKRPSPSSIVCRKYSNKMRAATRLSRRPETSTGPPPPTAPPKDDLQEWLDTDAAIVHQMAQRRLTAEAGTAMRDKLRAEYFSRKPSPDQKIDTPPLTYQKAPTTGQTRDANAHQQAHKRSKTGTSTAPRAGRPSPDVRDCPPPPLAHGRGHAHYIQ